MTDEAASAAAKEAVVGACSQLADLASQSRARVEKANGHACTHVYTHSYTHATTHVYRTRIVGTRVYTRVHTHVCTHGGEDGGAHMLLPLDT